MAYDFYVTVEGKTQGKIQGEIATGPYAGKILGLAFNSEALAPYDVATGHISGKRLYKPITFTKEWGISSPKLFAEFSTNETLKNVKFEFARRDPAGKEMIFYTIELENAAITGIRQYKHLKTNESSSSSSPVNLQELEEVSLVFHKITVTHMPSKTTAQDKWEY
jgi:type VI secretion system secreted protein Hcp